ncbi:MAG: ABC transporter ATP-binding protein, partial [Terriglobales bacterium]
TGTVVFVSHDRYFIDNLATRVFEIGEGRVEVYPGNYEDYHWRKAGGAAKLQESTQRAVMSAPSNGSKTASTESADSKTKRLNPIKRKQMEERICELEQKINRIETAIAENETALQSFVSAEETARLTQELETHRTALEKSLSEWEELTAALQN